MALTDNLVSYWKLDGNSNDSLGTNNGTDTNITYSTANGKINQGAGFAGTGVIQTTTSVLSGGKQGTFLMWIKSSTTGIEQGLLTKRSTATGANVFKFYITAGNRLTYWDYNGSAFGFQPSQNSNTQPNDGNRNLVGFIKDGTSGTYIFNGAADGTPTASNNCTYNSDILRIGYDLPDNKRYTGAADEVGAWDRALSISEVQQIYNSGAGLQYPFTSTFKPQIIQF